MEDEVEIRDARLDDAAAIADIYNFYVLQTTVTFEEKAVASEEMAARMVAVQAAELPWLVAVREGQVIGYAYAGRWSARYGYRFSAEVTVYLQASCGGGGIGSRLYERLLAILKSRGVHVAIGGIALPNAASVALHEKFGFRKVAHYREVGTKFGEWIDVGYWQKLLRER